MAENCTGIIGRDGDDVPVWPRVDGFARSGTRIEEDERETGTVAGDEHHGKWRGGVCEPAKNGRTGFIGRGRKCPTRG